ncbi:MAG: hypothetical protein Q8R74_10230, partial [Methylophilus sp.]|nr:hypothetical protein [Methylophilus sp.]
RGKNCKFIGFLDGNLNYRSMHISKQQFSRVAFPEQLLFDTFSGTTNYYVDWIKRDATVTHYIRNLIARAGFVVALAIAIAVRAFAR